LAKTSYFKAVLSKHPSESTLPATMNTAIDTGYSQLPLLHNIHAQSTVTKILNGN